MKESIKSILAAICSQLGGALIFWLSPFWFVIILISFAVFYFYQLEKVRRECEARQKARLDALMRRELEMRQDGKHDD